MEAANTSGAGQADAPSSEPSSTDPIDAGAWVGNLDGAPTTVEVGVDPNGIPELEATEAYRELVGGSPLRYVRVTIDNTGGSAAVPSAYADINGGTGANPDLVLDFVCAWVNSYWSISPDVSDEDAAVAFEAGRAASDALACMGDRAAAPGDVATYWLAAGEDQPQIDSLSIRFNEFAHRD
ncbi:MAG: hypothetical protein HKN44_12305 [Ilumatobacter sp.]|nr:hypothetical protein [Ilumatobacter sp.]